MSCDLETKIKESVKEHIGDDYISEKVGDILVNSTIAELKEILKTFDCRLDGVEVVGVCEDVKSEDVREFHFSRNNALWEKITSDANLFSKMVKGTSETIPGPFELIIGLTRLFYLPIGYYNDEFRDRFLNYIIDKIYGKPGEKLNLERDSEIIKERIVEEYYYYSEMFEIKMYGSYLTSDVTYEYLIKDGVLDLPLIIFFSRLDLKRWRIFESIFITDFTDNVNIYGNQFVKRFKEFKNCNCYIDYKESRNVGCRKLLVKLSELVNLRKITAIDKFVKSSSMKVISTITYLIKDEITIEKCYNIYLRKSFIEFIENYISNIYIMHPSREAFKIYKLWKKDKISMFDTKLDMTFVFQDTKECLKKYYK